METIATAPGVYISDAVMFALITVGFVVFAVRKAGYPDRIKVWGIEITFRKHSTDQDQPPP